MQASASSVVRVTRIVSASQRQHVNSVIIIIIMVSISI